jgi:hypothetical protein
MSTCALPYTEHIKRAFIDPIRSVLAIDDEYPTIDRILGYNEDELKVLVRNENWSRLEKLVKFCRNRQQELLIDVHDGSLQDLEHSLPLKSLRQCDWVVLDYQLNGSGGDGARSCEILTRLAVSDHFNLVTIYTQKSIDEVFKEVLIKFLEPAPLNEIPVKDLDEIGIALDNWSDSIPEIQAEIISTVSADVYLRLLERSYWTSNSDSCSDILRDFTDLYKKRPEGVSVPKKALLVWAARKFEENHGILPSASRPHCLAKAGLDDDFKWMLVGNLFVSFIRKDVEPEDLLDKTLECLAAWNPSPNRLALAKLRAELDASGILGDNDVMNDRNLQAYWLSKLIVVEEWERSEKIGALVGRQTELLFESLRTKVVSFTSEVLSSIERSDPAATVAHFFPGAIDARLGLLSHNTAVSTRPVGGCNLMPGHIFELGNSTGTSDLWMCLSPACDLIPYREGGRDLKKRLTRWLPFTAIKLFAISGSDSINKATQGHVVFVRHNETLKQYSLYPRGSSSSNPVWEELYAKDEGVLELPANTFTVAQLHTIEVSPPSQEGQERGAVEHETNFRISHCPIIAQLRGEYAVSLTQKLSSRLARIGLEFSEE